LLAAERAALEIGEYSPRLVKQTVAGYGNAEKHQVQQMVASCCRWLQSPSRMMRLMRWPSPSAIFTTRVSTSG
jgi:Holliday junction resolvasome RuvABC endonuclease subunit